MKPRRQRQEGKDGQSLDEAIGSSEHWDSQPSYHTPQSLSSAAYPPPCLPAHSPLRPPRPRLRWNRRIVSGGIYQPSSTRASAVPPLPPDHRSWSTRPLRNVLFAFWVRAESDEKRKKEKFLGSYCMRKVGLGGGG